VSYAIPHFYSEEHLFVYFYRINSTISIEDDKLVINVSEWKKMFDHVVNPILDTIEEIMTKEKNIIGKCSYLCIMGGLSESKYFQKRVRRDCAVPNKLELIISSRPILSVVIGAAIYAKGLRARTSTKLLTFRAIVGVDFGTDGIGIAYGINESMQLHNKWESSEYIKQDGPEKRRSIILLNERNDAVRFGIDARARYLELESGARDFKLFENFKMQLYDHSKQDERQSIKDLVIAANGTKFPSELLWI